MATITENACRICLVDSGKDSETIDACTIQGLSLTEWYTNFLQPDVKMILNLEKPITLVCNRCKLMTTSIEMFRQQCINNEILLKNVFAQNSKMTTTDDSTDTTMNSLENGVENYDDYVVVGEIQNDENLEIDLNDCILQVLSIIQKSHKNNFLCTICQNKFNFKYDLKRHCYRHFGIEIDKPGCDFCNATFMTHSDLKAHVVKQHSQMELVSCEKCKKTFYNNFTYKVHDLSAHQTDTVQNRKVHICPVCGFKTNRLSEHLSLHRPEDEYFVCDLCPDKSYRRKEDLKQHIKSIHLKIKIRKCSHCDRKFANWITLQMHLINDHKVKDYPFKCTYCSYKCCTKNRYIHHLRTHDEGKVYNLKIQQPIKEHLMHHTYTTKKSDKLTVALFQCPLCVEQPIFNFIELRNHFTIVHPDFEMKPM